MSFTVMLTDDAASDLEEIYSYIGEHDSPERANYVLDQIEKTFTTLSELPQRGAYPKELSAIGIREYREVFLNPTESFTGLLKEMYISC